MSRDRVLLGHLLRSSATFRRDECPGQTRLQISLYLLKHQPTLLRPAASNHGTGLEVLLESSASIPGVTPGGQFLGEDGTQKPWGPYVGREASRSLRTSLHPKESQPGGSAQSPSAQETTLGYFNALDSQNSLI